MKYGIAVFHEIRYGIYFMKFGVLLKFGLEVICFNRFGISVIFVMKFGITVLYLNLV
jgi:hypothetical protein